MDAPMAFRSLHALMRGLACPREGRGGEAAGDGRAPGVGEEPKAGIGKRGANGEWGMAKGEGLGDPGSPPPDPRPPPPDRALAAERG